MSIHVNYLAILIASIISMAAGFLWYSFLFRNPWMKVMGYTADSLKKAQKAMGKLYFVSFVVTILMAYVLSIFMTLSKSYSGYSSLSTGLLTAFWVWVGFVMPVQITTVLFGKEHGSKEWQLFIINTGYQLVSLVLMGATIGLMS